jgi:excisionase family DNA binding protein
MPEPEFYNQTEVANLLHCSPGTVKNLRERGLLPYLRPPGSRMVRFPRKEFWQFVSENMMNRKSKRRTKSHLELDTLLIQENAHGQ